MKKLLRIGAGAMLLSLLSGCFAVKISQPSGDEMRPVSESTHISQSEISGVEPAVSWDGNVVNVSVNLLGSFDLETRTCYSAASSPEEFVAIGFFPGVMSCRGEYGECLQNGAGVFFYNLVYAGLPTVYGLLVDPCVPYYPRQTESIVGRTAFLKSTLIGVCRYSRVAQPQETQKVSHSQIGKLRLENAVISASDLGLESVQGQPLQIPVDKLSSNGEVKVKLSLPADHPLKGAMSDFEGIEMSIRCIKKKEE